MWATRGSGTVNTIKRDSSGPRSADLDDKRAGDLRYVCNNLQNAYDVMIPSAAKAGIVEILTYRLARNTI